MGELSKACKGGGGGGGAAGGGGGLYCMAVEEQEAKADEAKQSAAKRMAGGRRTRVGGWGANHTGGADCACFSQMKWRHNIIILEHCTYSECHVARACRA